mmetsp:Transcript_25158/g.54342  ORF Transcript_25158/g.54342 Transcript_25158/m.54342 type:complete len:236 (-) Transcript_25158:719-1426(-)
MAVQKMPRRTRFPILPRLYSAYACGMRGSAVAPLGKWHQRSEPLPRFLIHVPAGRRLSRPRHLHQRGAHARGAQSRSASRGLQLICVANVELRPHNLARCVGGTENGTGCDELLYKRVVRVLPTRSRLARWGGAAHARQQPEDAARRGEESLHVITPLLDGTHAETSLCSQLRRVLDVMQVEVGVRWVVQEDHLRVLGRALEHRPERVVRDAAVVAVECPAHRPTHPCVECLALY